MHLINELLVVDFWAHIFSGGWVNISERDDLGIDLFHLEGASQGHEEGGLGDSRPVGWVLRSEQVLNLYTFLLNFLCKLTKYLILHPLDVSSHADAFNICIQLVHGDFLGIRGINLCINRIYDGLICDYVRDQLQVAARLVEVTRCQEAVTRELHALCLEVLGGL